MGGYRATIYVPHVDGNRAVKRGICGTDDEHARFVGALVERSRDVLMSYLAGLLGSRADAEDVFQETCVRLLDAKSLERDESRARAYAFRIASNLAYDRFRRLKAQRAGVAARAQHESDPTDSPEIIVHFEMALERMEETLLELRPRCRRVFLLRVAEGLAYEAIADKLRISKRTVEREMKQAIDACQEKLRSI